MPSKFAARVSDPVFDLGWFRCLDGPFPTAPQVVSIVRMNRGVSAFAEKRLLFAQAGEIGPAIIYPLEVAVRVARPDDLRQAIGQRTIGRVVSLERYSFV